MHPVVLFKLQFLVFIVLTLFIVFRGNAVIRKNLMLGVALHVGGVFFGFLLLGKLAQLLASGTL